MQMDLQQVVTLARIELTPEEQERLGPQLEEILKYVEKLKELDVERIEPMAHAVPLTNVTRADETRPSLPHNEAMQNAPRTANGLFIVPKIVE
jgi:aspartyl-tRNA(Asn)/glutamyl-tRNA(Gln) amidotransferase subunit C